MLDIRERREAQARVKINRLLEEAGCRFEDLAQRKVNIELEAGVKFSSLVADNYNELSKIKAAAVKYFVDRTAAYEKRRIELSRISNEKVSHLKISKTSAQIKGASEKYHLAIFRISEAWKAEI